MKLKEEPVGYKVYFPHHTEEGNVKWMHFRELNYFRGDET